MGTRQEESFRRLVDETWPSLVRLARVITGEDTHAEDLAQAALVSTYERLGRLRAPEAASAYARTTLVRAAMRHRTRAARELELHQDLSQPSPADPSVRVTDADTVRRALALLPPDQRAALALRYLLDLSEAQTAATLGVAIGTVKSRCSRGIATLREAGVLDTDPGPFAITGGTR